MRSTAGVPDARGRTAIHRPALSRPIQAAIDDEIIKTQTRVLDYGCGYGDDVRRLSRQGMTCEGWDPVHRPTGRLAAADVVNLGYVVNVIERAVERVDTLRRAWAFAQRVLIVSARLSFEAREKSATPCNDGWLTGTGTFQKYYEQQELRDWIDATLDTESVPAAPGIFYVFRDTTERQSFLAARFTRRTRIPRIQRSAELVDKHQAVLVPLIEFVVERGRLPAPDELDRSEIAEHFGSVKRAFSVIRTVTGPGDWDRIGDERAEDLLVYLALAKFGQRAKFGQLPTNLQRDIRAFFASYKRACTLADALLLSLGDLGNIERASRGSPTGKRTQTAFYVHVSALPELPSLLRMYEGCGRAIAGTIDGANIVKLSTTRPAVSYLSYPRFDRDPHPALHEAVSIDLQSFDVTRRDYSASENPPILHRKELFVTKSYPRRETFARLTRAENQRGLYAHPEKIGVKKEWMRTLEEAGLCTVGHRLLRATPPRPGTSVDSAESRTINSVD